MWGPVYENLADQIENCAPLGNFVHQHLEGSSSKALEHTYVLCKILQRLDMGHGPVLLRDGVGVGY